MSTVKYYLELKSTINVILRIIIFVNILYKYKIIGLNIIIVIRNKYNKKKICIL